MAKTTFLFWNMGNKPLLDLVTALAYEHRVDVLMLAECPLPRPALLDGLNTGNPARFIQPIPSFSKNVTILVRFPTESAHVVRESDRISIWRLRPPFAEEIILVTAHLPSKRYQSDADQAQHCTWIIRDIEEAEATYGHSRTILCGDLNMDPFEHGVVGGAGFHAVMTRRIAARGYRSIQHHDRKFFYNPMWSFFGDLFEGPPGTYYRRSPGQLGYFWHMFDQVLLRPSLLPRFDGRDLAILTTAGGQTLLTRDGTPDAQHASDHLPILFRIELSAWRGADEN